MFNKISLYIFLLALSISCKDQIKKDYKQSIIDRKKIDEVFRKDVSKILFDHLYVVVDSTTYSRLTNDNQWKNKYASFDIGLPDFAPVNDQASTFYMRGNHHYIEILGPENSYNEPIGKSGIGFSLKNNNEHFHLGVKPKLKQSKDSFLYATETVNMPIGEYKHIWFKAFYTPSSDTALHTWYGFYNSVFLDSLYGKHHGAYSREAFLESTYEKQKLFNGISEIHLTCNQKDYQRITHELMSLRCKILKKNGKKITIASGDVAISIEPHNEIKYSRITKIVCHLNNEDHSITQLGNLIITNEGTKSIWNFDKLDINNL